MILRFISFLMVSIGLLLFNVLSLFRSRFLTRRHAAADSGRLEKKILFLLWGLCFLMNKFKDCPCFRWLLIGHDVMHLFYFFIYFLSCSLLLPEDSLNILGIIAEIQIHTTQECTVITVKDVIHSRAAHAVRAQGLVCT